MYDHFRFSSSRKFHCCNTTATDRCKRQQDSPDQRYIPLSQAYGHRRYPSPQRTINGLLLLICPLMVAVLAALFIIEPVLRMPALDKARLTSVDKSPVTLAQEDEFFPHFTYWHWEELLPPRYTDTLFDVAAQHQ